MLLIDVKLSLITDVIMLRHKLKYTVYKINDSFKIIYYLTE